MVNGIQFGVRPDPLIGVHVLMQDRDNETDEKDLYGMELRLYPSEFTSIRLVRDTEETTELELNMKF
jgi:hypothetical protein